ncbi:hypothetical protein RvY_19333 [Ramazzottius varieornatus]|uniref:F-box domain-containing protein n=1 Tax=Ramazzottius varieornatus TaxID=947166 RepID=A0A1D1W923_RAMVA|nr:hypothetical protein RvY_19333 [Ramazzottius varieornatus]
MVVFDDIPPGVLDQLFQCVDFFQLLRIRRVCTKWLSAISRECAPFMRKVVIPMEAFIHCDLADMEPQSNFWQLAGVATTMLMFENPTSDKTIWESREWMIENVWKSYEAQVKIDERSRRVGKVVYANMTIQSEVFQCPYTRRIGFETVLINVTLKMSAHEIMSVFTPDVEDINSKNGLASVYLLLSAMNTPLTVKVMGRDSHKTSFTDRISTRSSCGQILPHPTSMYFALRHAVPLEMDGRRFRTVSAKLTWLVDDNVSEACLYFVGQLIKRIDPNTGAHKALDLIRMGDLKGFIGAVHPLVSTLFCYSLDPHGHPETRLWL